MLNTYDRAWSFVGLPLFVTVTSLVMLARTGAIPLVSHESVGDDLRITAGYWGLLLSSAGLLALGICALRYLHYRPRERITEPPWPRLLGVEDESRDRVISSLAFAGIAGTPLVAWFVFLLRYLDSRIAPWGAVNIGDVLADGFFASRLQAFFEVCLSQPCWRIHPPDGHQYIIWLSDPLLIVLFSAVVYIWSKWIRRVYIHDGT